MLKTFEKSDEIQYAVTCTECCKRWREVMKYQASGEGGTRSTLATPHQLQNPIGHSKQLSLNKFFYPSTPSMRKGRDGGKTRKKNRKKNGEKNGKEKEEKTDENSGHYVVASSRPHERRPLERRTLAPKANNGGLLIFLF